MSKAINYKQNINDPKLVSGQRIQRVLVDEEYVINRKESEYYYGLDKDREFVELHFYVPDTETLIYSTSIPLSEGYVVLSGDDLDDTGQFIDDGNFKLELYIWKPGNGNDYSNPESLQVKYLEGLPSGFYDVIINFFADEVGTYDDINWRIKTISPSKTEIVLHANPNQDGSGEVNLNARISRDYEQFLFTSIFYDDFVELINTYFNDVDGLYEDTLSKMSESQLNKISTVDNYIQYTFSEFVENLIKHIDFDIGDWMRYEQNSDKPGGRRYRIQQNRFQSQLEVILSEVVENHLVSTNTNDSGPVPFIVNQ